MAPPVPSPIDRIAQSVVTEYCVAKGQLVGFVDTTWLETRIAQLIRDTIFTENARCAKAVENIGWSSPTATGEWALREAAKVAAYKIRNLPIATETA